MAKFAIWLDGDDADIIVAENLEEAAEEALERWPCNDIYVGRIVDIKRYKRINRIEVEDV